MSQKIAVDVVLLPSEDMTQFAIQTNKKLQPEGSQKITLNLSEALPHISLLMGVMDENDLPYIQEKLDLLARRYLPLTLHVHEVTSKTEENGETNTVFTIQKETVLQQLHEEVIENIYPKLTTGVTKEMMYKPEEVNPQSFEWIDHFYDRHSLEHFEPHITIGLGDLEKMELPAPFHTYTLALCQLGNYCTCAKVLYRSRQAN